MNRAPNLRSAATVVRVEQPADLLAFRERIEAFARAGLHEPSFDLQSELARPFGVAFSASLADTAPSGILLGWLVADELHILSVVVDLSARRLGVGRALTERAIEHAATLDCRLVLLEVRRTNTAAIRLYRSLGFLAVRLRRAYYSDGDDAVEMARGLKPGALEALLPDEGEPAI